MSIDFSKVAVAISTHNRPPQLIECVRQWVETLPDYRAMHVIVNHPDGARGFVPPPRCQIIQSGRVPEHVGCMAKTWNLAMQWGFRDPEVEWLLCSMDDVVITPGWPMLLTFYDADLYMAPAGDIVFLMNRRALRLAGWFDERFPVIGFQEWDWTARAIRRLGLNRVSLDDAHGWHHNTIGLAAHWVHVGSNHTLRDMRFQGVSERWLEQKWGMPMLNVIGMISSGDIPEPTVPEIDFYPWFDRGTT